MMFKPSIVQPTINLVNCELITSNNLMTLDEGKTFCATGRAVLVLEGIDVNQMLNFLQTDEVWPGLYKSKLGMILDNDNYIPVISTRISEINNSNLLTPMVEGSRDYQSQGSWNSYY